MPLVSIIIPYYKKKKFISRCLKSIQIQSYTNYEIILIYDDENIDDFRYLTSLKKDYKKLLIFKNLKKKGAGESRNLGIKYAKGDYVAFLDSDDEWHQNKLKTQINLMQKNNWLISHTSYNIINEQGKTIQNRKAKNLNFNNLINSCDIGLSSVVVKKSILKNKIKFPTLKTKEDYVLWLKITKMGILIHGIDKNLMKWRKTSDSLSSFTVRKLSDGYSVYRIYLKYGIIKSLYLLFILSVNFFKKNYL